MTSGFAVILSAPSGTGKSTICRKLLQRDKSLRYSISCTTREPRPGERNGRDYHFLEVEDFKRKIHRDEFLEWAQVHDHYYGTPRRFFDETAAGGGVLLLAVDVQGANSIRRKRPGTVTVFIVPPSWRSLKERLNSRRHEPRESVERRLANARGELGQAKNYDYLVVNDSLDEAVGQIEAVITAERVRISRQDLSTFGLTELSAGRRH